eukprot:TRINITY_DN11856_c0_g2_i1.p1 TRINITY_DN11856_c0_g2~~TRINITY_DN11856_c0_g2_i1.p1  ORF type:complete len:467 (-),score=63.05 TRINITY_DN11856_c0_g2_i1:30-1430(-)
MVDKKGRCGKSTKHMQCSKEIICEKKCTKLRNCGRHECKRKCCLGDCPECPDICGNKLRCLNHKCFAPCHDGPCLPCPATVEVTCACGATRKTVPCGVERKTPPPRCVQLCAIPSLCHHPTRVPHFCHFGPCPPCKEICNCDSKDCNEAGEKHSCPLLCHDPAPPNAALWFKVDHRSKKTHQKKLVPPAPVTIDQVVCPQCAVIVKRPCLGEHEIFDKVCSTPVTFPCLRTCGNLLECGNHECCAACHHITTRRELVVSKDGKRSIAVNSEPDSKDTCQKCKRPCNFDRRCKHPCPLNCHVQECPPCEYILKQPCHCRAIKVNVLCWQSFDPALVEQIRCCPAFCQKSKPNCEHICQTKCHPGACPSRCDITISVNCPCKRIKAKWSCNEAQKVRRERGLTKENMTLLECDAACQQVKVERQKKREEEEQKRRETEEAEKLKLMKGPEEVPLALIRFLDRVEFPHL